MILSRSLVYKVAFLVCLAGAQLLSACAPATPLHPVAISPDPQLVDPEIFHGVLPNGFQYILKKNTTPVDKVSVHLNVFAGSMHETDQQQGIAHFLEHMLFNGSENFAPGELARYFPSIGMDFGADANAHTSFFNTVYDLDLPYGDEKQIDKAFVILQDYAKGALLLEEEIQREKGIILAEKRERDSVSYRTYKKTLEFELPGSRFVQRFPIGLEAVIQQADQDLLKTFYDQWYRPENMVMVMVGDFNIETVTEMIRQRFSQLTSRHLSEKTVKPDTTWVHHHGLNAYYHHEPEASVTDISIETIDWQAFEPETTGQLKHQMLAYMANTMLQARLSRMVAKQTASFSDAAVYSGSFLHNVHLSAIRASCEPELWEKSLGQIEQSLRQCFIHGFEQKELDRVKADFISALESQLDQSKTQKSKTISRMLLHKINQKSLLLSAGQRKTILAPYIASVTLEDTQAALVKVWDKDHRIIMVTGNALIDSPKPSETILDVYRNSLSTAVKQYQGFESHAFPYLSLPDFQTPIRSEEKNTLGITTIEFENNIRLQLKKTDFKQKEYLFRVCFGDGRRSMPASKPGLDIVAEEVLNSSGFSKMDTDQLEDALAGKKVSFSFDIHEDYFSFSGTADPEDAKLMFDLIHHFFNDPGYREQALNLSKIQYKQDYEASLRTPQGIMRIKGDAFLAGNDPRFGLAKPEVMDQYTLDDIQQWLGPHFKHSPVEISVVGDFDPETLIRTASKYAGALKDKNRFPIKSPELTTITFPEGEKLDLELETRIDTGVVWVAFLTDDAWDIQQTRRLSILSRVFSERLNHLIREELGHSYSPYVYNDPSHTFEGYGVMHVVVKVKPEDHAVVYEKIKAIVNSLVTAGVGQTETQMALNPVLNHIKAFRKTNSYWRNSVMSNASQYPEKFEWAENMEADYLSIDEKDLTRLVNQYLKMDRSARIVITTQNDPD